MTKQETKIPDDFETETSNGREKKFWDPRGVNDRKEMSTIIQAAQTTYASRVKTGNTPLIVPSSALIARNRSLITGTPLAAAPNLQSRPSFRSNSRVNGDDDEEDDDDEFLDVESEEGNKAKEEDGVVEESGGFVQAPPPDALIQKRLAVPTRHVYRFEYAFDVD